MAARPLRAAQTRYKKDGRSGSIGHFSRRSWAFTYPSARQPGARPLSKMLSLAMVWGVRSDSITRRGPYRSIRSGLESDFYPVTRSSDLAMHWRPPNARPPNPGKVLLLSGCCASPVAVTARSCSYTGSTSTTTSTSSSCHVLLGNLSGPAETGLHIGIGTHLLTLGPDDPLRIDETMLHLLEGEHGNARAAAYYGDPSLSEGELSGATRARYHGGLSSAGLALRGGEAVQ